MNLKSLNLVAPGRAIQLVNWHSHVWAEVVTSRLNRLTGEVEHGYVRYNGSGTARWVEFAREEEIRCHIELVFIPAADRRSGSIHLCSGREGEFTRSWIDSPSLLSQGVPTRDNPQLHKAVIESTSRALPKRHRKGS